MQNTDGSTFSRVLIDSSSQGGQNTVAGSSFIASQTRGHFHYSPCGELALWGRNLVFLICAVLPGVMYLRQGDTVSLKGYADAFDTMGVITETG